MSYAEQLQRLAAIERHRARVCLEPNAMHGEVFDKTLEPLPTQLYRAHRQPSHRAARRAEAPAPSAT
jgi:hypothetical protein